MKVDKLIIKQFRNYHRLTLDFAPGLNIISGVNGVGKTNILESLILLSNTKSFRTNNEEELIKDGNDYAYLEARSGFNNYRMVINKQGKALFINSNSIKKASDFIGRINTILFKPDDLTFFEQSPRYRRRNVDIELGKIDKNYLLALLQYNKLLKDKNNLLKNEKPDLLLLQTLNEELVRPIQILEDKRKEFITFINQRINPYFQALSQSKHEITITYHASLSTTDAIVNILNDTLARDQFYRYATIGPHKDDYLFYFDNHELAKRASQGQKRMTIIAFKLALLDYIKSESGEEAILLLDDILSELDRANKKRLLALLPQEVQILLTVSEIDNLALDCAYKLFKLEKGQVIYARSYPKR